MDNIYLKTELKYTKTSIDVLKARYQYGLVLIGMALIQADAKDEKLKKQNLLEETNIGDKLTIENIVFRTTSSIAPVLLPLIESLGNLTEEKIVAGSQPGDDE